MPENAHQTILPSHKLEQMFMLREERTISKDLSLQYKNKLYQIETQRVNSLPGKKVEILASKGEIMMVLQEGKPLKYHQWQERKEAFVKVVDVKELEVRWSDSKPRRYSRRHRWR